MTYRRWHDWRRSEWSDRVADVDEPVEADPLDLDDIIAGAVDFAETIVATTIEPLRAMFDDSMRDSRRAKVRAWADASARWAHRDWRDRDARPPNEGDMP